MNYRSELTKLLYMMAEVFQGNVSEPLIDAWTCVLQDEKVTIEEARAAAIAVMKSRQYNKLPPPGVFLEILRPPVNCDALADAQADLVLVAVRKIGPLAGVTFDDPITNKLMTVRWPWQSFCEGLLTDQVKWWRREFREAYLNEIEATSPPLLEAPEPKMLGTGSDQTECKESEVTE